MLPYSLSKYSQNTEGKYAVKFKLNLLASALALSSIAHASDEPFKINTFATFSNEDVKFDESAAEIVAFDSTSQKFFVVNAQTNTIDVLVIDEQYVFGKDESCTDGNLDLSLTNVSGGPNSVAVHNGLVAVAVEDDPKQNPGEVAFYNAIDCSFVSSIQVGALPDMLTFTQNGTKVIVANEGEPNDAYDIDPEGSISIIDISAGPASATVATADFHAFNGKEKQLRKRGIRIFGPNANASMDLEPEYITTSNGLAYVTLQENNALAVVDINKAKVISINSFGTKKFKRKRNALDYTNKDGAINIVPAPLVGMYQPDSVASFDYHGETYIVTANEGDARDYDGFSEEVRAEDLNLDANLIASFPGFSNKDDLGRPRVTNVDGDIDGDGDIDKVHMYGARSITVWRFNQRGKLRKVGDTGSILERAVADQFPALFNANNDADGIDNRSDDKGPEPEALTVEFIGGIPYAFVGLERSSLIAIFDLSWPKKPTLVQLFGNRVSGANTSKALTDGDKFVTTPGLDLGPEGLDYIPSHQSPTGKPLLAVANEVSGTTTLYTIELKYN